jgi:hypothetical protein
MSHPGEITEAVRQRLRHHFAAQGVGPEAELRESLLIRGGFYCGRRFACEGLQAVWFVEEGQLKLYARDGTLLLVEAAPNARPEVQLPAAAAA